MNWLFRKRLLLSVTLIVGAALAAWGMDAYFSSQETSPPLLVPSNVSTEGGLNIITLDQARQTLSGVQTAELKLAAQPLEQTVYGSVLDVQGLIDLRTRYIQAVADLSASQASAQASAQELQRSLALYKDNQNVSLQMLQAAQAQQHADSAKRDSAKANLQGVTSSARQQYGATLAAMLEANDPRLQTLLSGEQRLLQIVLPFATQASVAPRIQVAISTPEMESAELISAAPQSDPANQGQGYFYRASANLPIGSKIMAYLPMPASSEPAVLIPEPAILWFGGQPWVYVQIENNRFARRLVAEQTPDHGGYRVTRGFAQGDRVVVHGAQLLLSEEQRPQIAASSCKDPECDD